MLDLEPYNDIWLDCITNNLMSILIAFDSRYRALPSTFKTEYWKKIIFQKFDSEETYRSLLSQGLFLPKVVYDTKNLYSLFDINDKLLELADLNTIHELLQKALSEKKCVFLHIDRFFYPTGREAGKIHFVHPTFIYGYSDQLKCYKLFEDCLSPGKIHNYNISSNVIIESTKHLIEKGYKVRFRTVNLKESATNNYHFNFTDSIVMEIKNSISNNQIVYQNNYDLYYQLGISALDDYITEFEKIIFNCEDTSIFALRTGSFIQNHKKNSSLFISLHEKQMMERTDLLELAKQADELSSCWDIYRSVILKSMITGKHRSELKDHLQNIVKLEYEYLKKMRLAIVSREISCSKI